VWVGYGRRLNWLRRRLVWHESMAEELAAPFMRCACAVTVSLTASAMAGSLKVDRFMPRVNVPTDVGTMSGRRPLEDGRHAVV
jgi:hypothetical protein